MVSLPGQQQLICYADHLTKLESSCVQILYSGGYHTLSSPKVAQSSAKTISKFTIQVKFMPTHYAKSFNMNFPLLVKRIQGKSSFTPRETPL